MTRRSTRTLIAAVAVLLTLSCLGPLFAPGGGWVGPALIAIAVAAAAGSLGRLLPLPALLGPLVSAAAGILVITAVSSPGDAHLGFLPSGATWGTLSDLFSAGYSDVQTYAPPVEISPGLILISTTGVFAVAAVVDLLAVTADRPLLAGIPLLGLVAVPAAFRPSGLGLLHIGLAACGWLLLLAVDGRDRQLRWGRPLGRPAGGRSGVSLVGSAAGRVAGVGLVAGLALPALIPSLHGGIFHPPSHCCGGGQARVVEPLVTLDQQLSQQTPQSLLTVSTINPQYLRFTALDNYNNDGFSLVTSRAAAGRVDGPLSVGTPGISPLVPTQNVQDTITVDPTLAEKYLPLPYSPVSVNVPGDWQLIPGLRTVFSPSSTTAGLTFQVTSEVPVPSAQQLRQRPGGYDARATPADVAAQLQPDLTVPSSVPAILGTVADRVTRTGRTAYDKLFLLEQYFTDKAIGGYTYQLAPGLPAGAAGITDFLTSNRNGFCQQFATVFTLMARHLGLPARVGVGFTPGQLVGPSTYEVSTADAHAWPEVWFTGVGWVRFEPTPRSDIAPFRPGYLTGQAAKAPVTAPATPAPVASAPAPLRKPDGTTQQAAPVPAAAVGGSGHHNLTWLWVALVVLAALALLALPGALRLLSRRRRLRLAAGGGPARDRHADAEGQLFPPDAAALAAHAAWSEVLDTLVDLGLPLVTSETPRATGRRIAGVLTVDAPPPPLVAVGADDGADDSSGLNGARSGARRSTGWRDSAGESSRAGAGTAVLDRVGTSADVLDLRGERDTGPARSGGAATPAARSAADAVAALTRLRTAEEAASYGRPGGQPTPAQDLAQDVGTVRGALLDRVGGGRRMRALVLPRSTLAGARRGVLTGVGSLQRQGGRLNGLAVSLGDRFHKGARRN